VLEASEVLEKVLIAPLSDDPIVVDLPDRIASAVFRGIMKHAKHCIYVAERLLEDTEATVIFIATGGAGPGMASMNNSRNIRDAIFIGLDLLEELWQWRNHVAQNLRGTHEVFDLLVDDELRDYCSLVLDLLNHYRNSKGQLDEEQLLEDDALRAAGKIHGITEGLLEGFSTDSGAAGSSGGGGRRSWFPSPDCSTHESSINMIYLLRTLFVDYFGSLKLVLSDGDVDASDPEAALEYVKSFVEDCVEGHIHDIGTIGDAAAMLQQRDQDLIKPDASKLAANARKMAKMVSLLPRQTMSGIPLPFGGQQQQQQGAGGEVDDGGKLPKSAKGSTIGARASGSGKVDVHISSPIFALNNLFYLAQNLQQHFFSRRTQIVLREVEVIRSSVVANANSLSAGLGLGAQRTLAVGSSPDVSALWSQIAAKQKKGAAEAEAAERQRKEEAAAKKAKELASLKKPPLTHTSATRKSNSSHGKNRAAKGRGRSDTEEDENEDEEDEDEAFDEEEEEYEEWEETEEGEEEEEEEEVTGKDDGDAEDEDDLPPPLSAPPSAAFGVSAFDGARSALAASLPSPPNGDDAAAGTANAKKKVRRVKVPLLEELVDSIKGRGGGWVLAYRQSWDRGSTTGKERTACSASAPSRGRWCWRRARCSKRC